MKGAIQMSNLENYMKQQAIFCEQNDSISKNLVFRVWCKKRITRWKRRKKIVFQILIVEDDNVERWVFDNRYARQSVNGFCNANDSWKFFSANIQYGRQSVVQIRFCMDEKKQTLLRLNWVFHCIVLLMNKNKKKKQTMLNTLETRISEYSM